MKRGQILFREQTNSSTSATFGSTKSTSWDVVKITSVNREGQPLRLAEWYYGGWSSERKIQPYEAAKSRYIESSTPITETMLQRMPQNKGYWATGEELFRDLGLVP